MPDVLVKVGMRLMQSSWALFALSAVIPGNPGWVNDLGLALAAAGTWDLLVAWRLHRRQEAAARREEAAAWAREYLEMISRHEREAARWRLMTAARQGPRPGKSDMTAVVLAARLRPPASHHVHEVGGLRIDGAWTGGCLVAVPNDEPCAMCVEKAGYREYGTTEEERNDAGRLPSHDLAGVPGARAAGAGGVVMMGSSDEQTPQHYRGGDGIQPLDVIDQWGLTFCNGNAVKYLLRWRRKGGTADLAKAIHYVEFTAERAEWLGCLSAQWRPRRQAWDGLTIDKVIEAFSLSDDEAKALAILLEWKTADELRQAGRLIGKIREEAFAGELKALEAPS